MSVVKSAVLVVLLALLVGCSFSGQIGISSRRVWRQDTIGQDAASRIGELRVARDELNEALKSLAGWRLRKEIIDTKIRASASRVAETSGKPAKVAAPDVAGSTPQDLPGLSLPQVKSYYALGEHRMAS